MPSKGSVLPNKAASGCRNCRNRRIICDGGEPCRKCLTKGLECEWGKGRIKIRFKDETRKLVEKHADTTRKSSAAQQETVAKEAEGTAPASPGAQRWKHIHLTSNVLPLSPSTLAEKIFFENPDKTMRGMLGDPWITTNFDKRLDTTGKPYLQLAIETISLSSFANALKRPDVERAAAVASIRCARELRSTLATWEPGASTDDLLFSILLLITNEFVVYKYKGPDAEPDIRMHVKGALAIAAQTLSHGRLTPRQKHLMSTLRLDAGWDSMIAGVPLPAFMYTRDDPDEEINLEDQLEALYMKGVKFRAESRTVHAQNDEEEDKYDAITTLIEEAQAMSTEVGDWTEKCMTDYDMQVIGSTYAIKNHMMVEDLEVWPGTLVTCDQKDIAQLFRLGKAHQLRIFALSIVIRGLCWMKMQHTAADPDTLFPRQQELALAIYTTKETVNILCGMLTVVLGLQHPERLPPDLAHLKDLNLNGGAPFSLVAWGRILLTVEGLPDLQRRWIVGRMRFVGATLGIKIATYFSYIPPSLIFPSSDVPVDVKFGAVTRRAGLSGLLDD